MTTGWTRVTDKLPGNTDYVLMFFHRVGSRDVGTYSPGSGWRSNPWGMGEEVFPSHWMPIADAPGDDEVDETFRKEDAPLQPEIKDADGKYTLAGLTRHFEHYDRDARTSLISEPPLSAAVVLLCDALIGKPSELLSAVPCKVCGGRISHDITCPVPLAIALRYTAENYY